MPQKNHKNQPARVHANLTPLIDVTFLLIVFFVLVAQITNSQIVDEIKLPEPENAVSIEPPPNDPARLTLNVLPQNTTKNSIASYRLGSRDYPATPFGITTLTHALQAAQQKNPAITIDLRADKSTPYSRIFPALNATSRAGITRLNLLVQATDHDDTTNTKNQNGG